MTAQIFLHLYSLSCDVMHVAHVDNLRLKLDRYWA